MTIVQIPDDTAAQLRQVAEDEGRTLEDLAGEGLAAYLASHSGADRPMSRCSRAGAKVAGSAGSGSAARAAST